MNQQNKNHLSRVKCQMSNVAFQMLGFTILELIIGIAVITLIAAGIGLELVAYQRGTVVDAMAKDIVSELRLTQAKALNGEDGNANGQGDPWGVRFTNSTNDLYEVFYGSSYNVSNVKQTVYLPGGVKFTDPAESANKDIVYTAITGTTTPTTLTIATTDDSRTNTITVATSTVSMQ